MPYFDENQLVFLCLYEHNFIVNRDSLQWVFASNNSFINWSSIRWLKVYKRKYFISQTKF